MVVINRRPQTNMRLKSQEPLRLLITQCTTTFFPNSLRRPESHLYFGETIVVFITDFNSPLRKNERNSFLFLCSVRHGIPFDEDNLYKNLLDTNSSHTLVHNLYPIKFSRPCFPNFWRRCSSFLWLCQKFSSENTLEFCLCVRFSGDIIKIDTCESRHQQIKSRTNK